MERSLMTKRDWLTALLPIGETNAVTVKELVIRAGLSDTRALTKQIEWERRRGVPICATGQGFYIPATPGELERYLKRRRSRERTQIKATEAMQRTLDHQQGQQSLFHEDGVDRGK